MPNKSNFDSLAFAICSEPSCARIYKLEFGGGILPVSGFAVLLLLMKPNIREKNPFIFGMSKGRDG